MIKDIRILYCVENEKYDLFIDNEWKGKYYTLKECIKALLRRHILESEK